MDTEFPAGLSRSDIDFILHHDQDVGSVDRIRDALWRITYTAGVESPVEILIDNGVNDIYIQSLIQVDADHVLDALTATGPIAVVGLAILRDTLFMRSAIFIEHSTMHAFTNSYNALALAYGRYQAATSA